MGQKNYYSVGSPKTSYMMPRAHVYSKHLVGDVVAFIIPSLMFLDWDLGGRLFLSEILLLCLLPILLVRRIQWLLAPLPKKFLLLGLLWLCAQIFTDIIRQTPFEDWSRGWSKIIFLLLNFSSLYLLLYNRKRRLLVFAVGIAVGSIANFYISPHELAFDYPWKFGVGAGITLLMVLSTQWRKLAQIPLISEVIIGAAAILNFYQGFRSLGAFCLVTALYILYQRRFNINKVSTKPVARTKNFIVALLLASFSIFVIGELYGYVAGEGWLGDDAKHKYEMQAGGQFGLLLGGRGELFASTEAIMDSPIIGHGSWAKDPKYRALMLESLSRYGYVIEGKDERDLIPTHSYLFGAWVEAGVVGAVFWLWVLLLPAKLLIAMRQFKSPLVIWLTFVAVGLIWDILFSPLGAEGRVYAAYNIVLMMFGTTLVVNAQVIPSTEKKLTFNI